MRNWRRQLLMTLLLGGVALPLWAEESPDDTDRRIAATRWIGAGVISAWGLLNWDYGEQSMHATSEGWFGADTNEGGADKMGHLYTSYVMTRAFDGLYRHWGAEGKSAARDAAISSLLITGFMELGDGFSPYGVSYEDMIMNVAGSLVGYQLATNETWERRLDLRMEYVPSGSNDPLTDYENARYLMALKLDGFSGMAQTPLKWLELHAGYYVRGFDDPAATDHRIAYVGIGINLTSMFERAGWHRTSTFLQYYQVPGTSVRAEHEY